MDSHKEECDYKPLPAVDPKQIKVIKGDFNTTIQMSILYQGETSIPQYISLYNITADPLYSDHT